MLIPLGTDRALRRPTTVTPLLMALCGLGYIAQMLLDGGTAAFTSKFWVGGPTGLDAYTPITYQFLHGGLLHLLGNMLFLWVFGRAVEDKLGRLGFTLFYLAGGAFAGVLHAWFEQAPAVGASGSISAVTGAFLVLFPRTRIKVIWFFILISFMQAPAWFFIGLQIAWNLLAQVSGKGGDVAVLAHLAGYAFGFGIAFILLWSGKLSREPYDLFTISKQAKRRREFRSLNPTNSAPSRTAPQRGRAEDGVTEAIASSRAAVSKEISAGRLDDAVAPYRLLVQKYGKDQSAVTLARNTQYKLALHLASAGDAGLACRALGDFAGVYPRDPETPGMRILQSRLLAGSGKTESALELLTDIRDTAASDEDRELAETELLTLRGKAGPHPHGAEETT